MRILFLGDIVGRKARQTLLADLPNLIQYTVADFAIVNVENAAGGFGVTPDIADQCFAAGADVLTTGNHVWDRREIIPYIDNEARLLRPLNIYAPTPGPVPGRGSVVVAKGGKRLAVIHCQTNLFMPETNNMFADLATCLDKLQLKQHADAIVIDVHGEATSEKAATGIFVDGRASLVVGTHTHVPTADYRILAGGTAFISDVGMCGDYSSVIGMEAAAAVSRFTGEDGPALNVAKGESTLCGVVVDTDDSSGLAVAIYPLRRGGALMATPPIPAPANTTGKETD